MVVNKGPSTDIFVWDALHSYCVCVCVCVCVYVYVCICMYVCVTRNENLNVYVFKVSFHMKHVEQSTVSRILWVFLNLSVTSHHLQTH